MKEKEKELERSFNPLVLYLEDLEKIEKCFKQAGWKIEIETKDLIFESTEELKKQIVEKEQKSYLTRVKVIVKEQTEKDLYEGTYGRLEFSPDSDPLFYFTEDNTKNRGILSQIEDILDNRERKGVLSYSSLIISFIVWMGVILWGTPLIEKFSPLDVYQSLYSVLFMIFIHIFLWGGWSIKIRMTESALIILKRKEQTSFWQRNKEKIFWRIIVPVIAACLGGILGAFFTHLLNK